MSLICIDTHLLIWGIKGESEKGQEDKVANTKAFFSILDKDDVSILIPAIVVAEFLIPVPLSQHASLLQQFNKNFIVAPFDELAASKFSLIWNTNKPAKEAEAIIKGKKTRAELRADSMIVAIAVARKAECIYSEDDQLKAFAKGIH